MCSFILYTVTTTTMCTLLVLSISWGILVACANFLLCVFLWDGTVALSSCLKDTKTFDLGFAKGHVWDHVAMAPGGAQSWWRGEQTWHATHTLWPCPTGNSFFGWSILGACFFRQTLGRFYGLIIEAIYWLSEWHICTHMQNTADKNKHIQKHGETQTRGENEISNSCKTASHRWTHWKNHARGYNIIHKNILYIFTYNNIYGHHGKRIKLATDRCVCVGVCAIRPFAHHSCPWNEAQTASCQYQQRSVQLGCGWPVSCGFGGGAVWAGPRGSSFWHPDQQGPTSRADPEPCLRRNKRM